MGCPLHGDEIMGVNLDVVDPTFLADLRASAGAVEAASRWLVGNGFPVMMRPTFERPDAEQRADYADGGDLAVLRTVEVKHRNLLFVNRDTYPFPTVLLDPVGTFDRKRPRPWLYLIVNKQINGALLVYVQSTFGQWQQETIVARGRTRAQYLCPVELTKYTPL